MSSQPHCRALITGLKGLSFTAEERAFLETYRPWGLILFKRNIQDRLQVSKITEEFRSIVGRASAPVLVDQEGGRVQRLGPPHWPAYPPAARFHQLAGHSDAQKVALAGLSARLMAEDLRAVGITVDCLPVLDVPAPEGHGVIGDRAYADEPAIVARYGRAVIDGLLAGGVLPVIKHIPGHGRANADSHMELPVVHASLAELERIDFAPFRALNDAPLAMTAHVVFTALDPLNPATTSKKVVAEIIRGAIGFDGLLMSDDLSMKALSGSFAERSEAVFAAGVDVALHCNGDLAESVPVAKAAPILAGRALERAERALARLETVPDDVDLVDARAKVDLVLASAD